MRKTIFGCLMALGILACKIAGAETYVSGTITGDTTWNFSGSPYIATETVYVADGVKLTIDPGVTIRFATETSLICYGTLNAIGTAIGTITFTSSQTTPMAGDWNGIKLSGSGANGSQIKYCDIGYAKQAVYLKNTLGIVITNNFIHDNKGADGRFPGEVGCGVYLSSSTNTVISSNIIFQNEGGKGGNGSTLISGASGGIGCGIHLSDSDSNIIATNIILSNIGGRGGMGGYQASGGQGEIGCGIYLYSSINNNIRENTITSSQGGGGGAGGSYGSGGTRGNGYGIYLEPNSYNNTITTSNTYNNEPIFYFYGITIPTIIENQTLTLTGSGSTNLGRIVLINCSNFTIRNNTISGGIGENGYTGGNHASGGSGRIGCGIYLYNSTNTTILENTITNNQGGNGGTGGNCESGGQGGIGCGIYLYSSINNTIQGNTIASSQGGSGGGGGPYASGGQGGIGCGIYLYSSINNTIQGNTIASSQGGSGGGGGYLSG
ncbi:MAG: right-handed parallel beta-helix repeat-containing protein, partial [bacterium]